MILIIDFGSQTAHLIGRRLHRLGVAVIYAEPEEALAKLKKHPFKGIILSGGPASVYEPGAPMVDPSIFHQKIPVLGICYGWQLMARLLGGKVKSGKREYGPEQLFFSENIFDLPVNECTVFMSHGDTVEHLPRGFSVFAATASTLYAGAMQKEKRFYGLQFHPEVGHTEQGLEILRYFATEICGCVPVPSVLNPEDIIEEISDKVGPHEVIGGVSGGVDSTVAAYLIAKAIHQRFYPIYIESGLMREGTEEKVREIFTHVVPASLIVVDARQLFLDELNDVEDSEVKRKIIGRLYVELFQEEALKLPDAKFLAQGTIYSDVIESKGTKHASHIKSHHNVGGLPESLNLQLLEPLRQYYKDEVREMGWLAGLPESLLNEHPFPGPGYAIRIRGKVNEKRLAQVKIADNIVNEEIKKAGLYDRVFQCFAVMTGAYSSYVKGDHGAFGEVVAVRAYESTDVMTLRWAKLPYKLMQTISSRIVNEVPEVSRVVYDITTKPPATMEWE